MRVRSRMPLGPVRAAVAAAWRLRLMPGSPGLVDLALSLPVMDTSRARSELAWEPSHTSLDAIREMLQGLRGGAGMETPTLDPHAGGALRQHELATGVGKRATPSQGKDPEAE